MGNMGIYGFPLCYEKMGVALCYGEKPMVKIC